MEMTTPVISTGGQTGPDGDKMQFPMENKFGTDPEVLPLPDDSRYVARVCCQGQLGWCLHLMFIACACVTGVLRRLQVTCFNTAQPGWYAL